MIVVDASIALAWSFKDERTAAVLQLFQRVVDEGAIAPSIWPMEIANTLLVAIRKKRISRPYHDELIANFMRLPVRIEHQPGARFWYQVSNLAQRHQLTIYDATYLDLAIRLGLPLATLDNDLAAAARAEAIPVLP